MYPDDVAGMVFIDPLNYTIFERLNDRQSADDDELVRKALAGPPSGRRSEVEFMAVIDKDFAQLKALKMPPDVPMVLLIAGKHEAGQVWVRSVFEEYSPIIFSSSEGGMTVAATTSHYIHRDDPELVIESIRRVVFPSVKRVLENVLKSSDIATVERRYREMRKHYPTVYFLESDLNSLGYARVRAKDLDGAIRLFKLNVEMYPLSANPYDSLGEAYALRGDRDLAIRNYKMVLKLDPESTSALKALEKLEAVKK
jgi:tetratricopeptide (TPR) repeat protein